jgi:hypothetical protein
MLIEGGKAMRVLNSMTSLTFVMSVLTTSCGTRASSEYLSSSAKTGSVFAPVDATFEECRYSAALEGEIGGEEAVRVSAGVVEGDDSLYSSLYIPVKDLPLKHGIKKVIKTRLGTQEWSYDSEKGLLKGVTTGSSDFLENHWIELTIDPLLQKPKKLTVKWSMALKIPFKTKSCRFTP